MLVLLCYFSRQFAVHRNIRTSQHCWQQYRTQQQDQFDIEQQIILNELYVEKEIQRIEKEEKEETTRLQETFTKWEKQVTHYALNKTKLPKNWVSHELFFFLFAVRLCFFLTFDFVLSFICLYLCSRSPMFESINLRFRCFVMSLFFILVYSFFVFFL